MTLGHTSLGLVMVLFLVIVPTLAFQKVFIYLHILALMLVAFGILVNVSEIPDFFFAFMENCLLVVITSHVWDVVFILCFCGAIGGSTLFTLPFSCITNGATKVAQHLLHRYGHTNFLVHCALQPLECRLYLRPKLLWESTLLLVADCWAPFTPSSEYWSYVVWSSLQFL